MSRVSQEPLNTRVAFDNVKRLFDVVVFFFFIAASIIKFFYLMIPFYMTFNWLLALHTRDFNCELFYLSLSLSLHSTSRAG